MAPSLVLCANCGHYSQAHNQQCNTKTLKSGFQKLCSCSRFVPPTEPSEKAA